MENNHSIISKLYTGLLRVQQIILPCFYHESAQIEINGDYMLVVGVVTQRCQVNRMKCVQLDWAIRFCHVDFVYDMVDRWRPGMTHTASQQNSKEWASDNIKAPS